MASTEPEEFDFFWHDDPKCEDITLLEFDGAIIGRLIRQKPDRFKLECGLLPRPRIFSDIMMSWDRAVVNTEYLLTEVLRKQRRVAAHG